MFEYFLKFAWYQPTFTVDSRGKRVRLGKYPKGCLYDRNVNYKPIATPKADKENSKQISGSASENPDNSILISPDVGTYFKINVFCARNNYLQ